MNTLVFNIIGIVGVGLVVVEYFLAASGKVSAKNLSFHLLNIIAALLIIISLMHDWNLPQFVLEFAWVVVSIYGLVKNSRNFARRAKILYKFRKPKG